MRRKSSSLGARNYVLCFSAARKSSSALSSSLSFTSNPKALSSKASTSIRMLSKKGSEKKQTGEPGEPVTPLCTAMLHKTAVLLALLAMACVAQAGLQSLVMHRHQPGTVRFENESSISLPVVPLLDFLPSNIQIPILACPCCTAY